MYEEYLEHFTDEISKEIKEYTTEDVLKTSRYIFTERRGKQQYGHCTHCNNEFRTTGLKHNDETKCPYCKSECTVKSSGLGRKYMRDSAYFVYYEKSMKDVNTIVAKGIYTWRTYSGDYKNIETKYQTRAIYIFEPGKSTMLKACYYRQDHFEIGKTIYSLENNEFNSIKITCSKESIKQAVKGTQFQYSMWEKYCDGSDMVKYFDLYTKYPRIEDLTKLALKDIVEAKLYGRGTYSSVNWKAKTVFKMLRLNKAQLKALRESGFEIDTLFLRLYQISIKDKSNLSLEEIKELHYNSRFSYRELLSIHKYTSLKKINNYIGKQKEKEKLNYAQSIYTTWRDYIEDCKRLEWDLSKENILFPKDLYKAHQNTIRQVKYKADETLNKKIKARAEKVNSKFYFEYGELIIRAANSSIELIEEGKALSHCVGGYANKYAEGITNILVIRKASDMDMPYYTVEIDNKKRIVQIRGKRNCEPTEDVKEFINAFKIEKLKKKSKKAEMKIPA